MSASSDWRGTRNTFAQVWTCSWNGSVAKMPKIVEQFESARDNQSSRGLGAIKAKGTTVHITWKRVVSYSAVASLIWRLLKDVGSNWELSTTKPEERPTPAAAAPQEEQQHEEDQTEDVGHSARAAPTRTNAEKPNKKQTLQPNKSDAESGVQPTPAAKVGKKRRRAAAAVDTDACPAGIPSAQGDQTTAVPEILQYNHTTL